MESQNRSKNYRLQKNNQANLKENNFRNKNKLLKFKNQLRDFSF